ncbi:MAG: DUF1059 domain-containing protein [Thermoplasmatota archaeon]
MQVSCAPECGFVVQSHDERELIGLVRLHAYEAHGKEVTVADVQGMEKPIQTNLP